MRIKNTVNFVFLHEMCCKISILFFYKTYILTQHPQQPMRAVADDYAMTYFLEGYCKLTVAALCTLACGRVTRSTLSAP